MPEGGGLKIEVKELGVRDGTSPIVTCDLDSGQRTTRKYLIDWEDYADAHWQLLGYSYLDSAGALKRYLPQRDPDFPHLWANRVTRIMGGGWRDYVEKEYGSVNVNEVAAVEVEFAPRPYTVLDDSEITGGLTEVDRFVEIEARIDNEVLSQNSVGKLLWAFGSGASPPYPWNVGKAYSKQQYTFRWHQIPFAALPYTAINNAVGRVNSDTFGTRDLAFFQPGQLLLLGVGLRIVRMPRKAEWGWTVDYNFAFREQTWNKFYNFRANEDSGGAVQPGFYQISTDGTVYTNAISNNGKLVYDAAPFFEMFLPEP